MNYKFAESPVNFLYFSSSFNSFFLLSGSKKRPAVIISSEKFNNENIDLGYEGTQIQYYKISNLYCHIRLAKVRFYYRKRCVYKSIYQKKVNNLKF